MKLLRKNWRPFPARTVHNLQAILMMERGMTARPLFSRTRANEKTNNSQNMMPQAQVVNEFYENVPLLQRNWLGAVLLLLGRLTWTLGTCWNEGLDGRVLPLFLIHDIIMWSTLKSFTLPIRINSLIINPIFTNSFCSGERNCPEKRYWLHPGKDGEHPLQESSRL